MHSRILTEIIPKLSKFIRRRKYALDLTTNASTDCTNLAYVV